MSRTPQAPTDDTVLRADDKVRVSFDLARRVGRRPTAAVLTVTTLARTKDGVAILGLRWGPSASPGKFEDVAMLRQANQDEAKARAMEETEEGG